MLSVPVLQLLLSVLTCVAAHTHARRVNDWQKHLLVAIMGFAVIGAVEEVIAFAQALCADLSGGLAALVAQACRRLIARDKSHSIFQRGLDLSTVADRES